MSKGETQGVRSLWFLFFWDLDPPALAYSLIFASSAQYNTPDLHLQVTAFGLASVKLVVLQEEGPLPGPETGLLSNTWK